MEICSSRCEALHVEVPKIDAIVNAYIATHDILVLNHHMDSCGLADHILLYA